MGNTFGIISLICGLLSIILTFFLGIYGIFFPIIAIVFGGIGIAKDDSRGMAIAGLILGIIAFIFWILFLLLIAALFAALFGALSVF
ncbi:MAG: hypothetical protein ACXABO_04550 [Promethearchaeota archaeon]|jgi:hypothetical protein